ncbi:hypothetical protein LINPERPRIM_LOCUS8867, partial [Linum perenne]
RRFPQPPSILAAVVDSCSRRRFPPQPRETEIRVLRSISTWLSSISWNSGLRIASSSTATTWLDEFPMLVELNSPKCWLATASVKSVVGEIVKAMSWLPPEAVDSGTMAKTKVVENEREELGLNVIGWWWKSWPVMSWV